jgi:hypothetical protein
VTETRLNTTRTTTVQPDKTESGKQKAEIGASAWSIRGPRDNGTTRQRGREMEKLKC